MTRFDSQHMPDPIPDQPFDPWNFRSDVALEIGGSRLAGYTVDPIDGRLGRVADASLVPNDSYLLVRTGWWVFGSKFLLPAGTVSHVDPATRTAYLDRTRGQIRSAPRVPPEEYDDPLHREGLADYYRSTYHPTARR